MRIILKHTIKNILKKPLRTLLLLFCIAVCSFTAMLSLDMTGTVDHIFTSLFGQIVGTTDLIFSSDAELNADMFKDLPESTIVMMPASYNEVTVRNGNPALYTFVDSVNVEILGVDFKDAYDLKLFSQQYEIGTDEMLISDKMAEKFDLAVGDSFTLYTNYGDEKEFKVAEIISDQSIFTQSETAVVSLDAMKILQDKEDLDCYEALIDVKDQSQVNKVKEILEQTYPHDTITATSGAEEVQEASAQISQLFFVLFAICMLIVVFITITVSEKIVIERMSVIGTLRSIGVSNGKTAAILLAENSLYGLLGSLFGVWLYGSVRLSMLGSLFSLEGSGLDLTMDFGQTKGYVYVLIIIGAILLEDLCPLKSIIHATKRSIRDVIFDNQDTEYHMSSSTRNVGLGLLVVAIVSAFFKESFAAMIICLGASVGALSTLFPYVIKVASVVLQKFFAKRNKPIAHLAAIEIYSKKSNVGSARLAVTATSLALVLFIVSNSLGSFFAHSNFKCDVIASLGYEKANMYSYMKDLDGVSDFEFLYEDYDYCLFGEKEKIVSIFGFDQYELFQGIMDLPENLNDDEFVMDKYLAEELKLSVGDEVELTLSSKSFLPIKKTLKLVGLCNSTYYNNTGEAIVIPMKIFRETYRDYPAYAFMRCDDPQATKTTIEQYSAGLVMEVMTNEEYQQELESSTSSVNTLLYTLMVMSVLLTFIGTVSNQFVGFQGRKRECAVLVSVAMPRKKLAKLFTHEAAISMFLVVLVACPMSLLLAKIVQNIMAILEMNIPIAFKTTNMIVIAVVVWVVFLATSLFPRRSLRKMKVAEQLKYE